MTRFEKGLKLLFDGQSFFRGQQLGAVIREISAKPLPGYEFGPLFAAGDAFANGDRKIARKARARL